MPRILPCSVAALILASAASAQGSLPAFNVNIGSVGDGSIAPSSSFGGAGPVGVWNQLDVDAATAAGLTYTTPTLLTTSGATSGVTVEWESLANPFGAVSSDANNTFGDDAALLDYCGFVFGPGNFHVRGLPAGVYDVITYAMAPDSTGYLTRVSVVDSIDSAQDVGGDFSLGYFLGRTHAQHTVRTVAGGVLTIQTDAAFWFDSVNGFQIFESGTGPGDLCVGAVDCAPAVANSSGAAATLSALGSSSVGNNALTLRCTNLPTQSFGFFLATTGPGNVASPGTSQGVLCLGGSIGRYVGPGEILNSGVAGTIQLSLDLNAVPQPTGFVAVQPGDVWYFTTWFRDSVGGVSTSNFSDALCVAFI